MNQTTAAASASAFESQTDRQVRLVDRLALFSAEAQHVVDEIMLRYSMSGKRVITVERGRRYARLVISSAEHANTDSRSVYGFVDMTTGDVYKSESWKKPSKRGAVGNIFEQPSTWNCLGLYGVCGR